MAGAIIANNIWLAILGHCTTSEAVSNGIWYEILRRYFPFPRFIIAPEQHNQAGARPDLTVFFIDAQQNWGPIFTFEGKAPNQAPTPQGAAAQFYQAIQQAGNYLPGLNYANALNGRRFGMVAAGKSLVFIVHNGGQPTQWNQGNVNINTYNPPAGWNVWDIQHNQAAIDGFLTTFANSF